MTNYRYKKVYHKQPLLVWMNFVAVMFSVVALVIALFTPPQNDYYRIVVVCFGIMCLFNLISLVANFQVKRERVEKTLVDELLEK